MFADLLQMTHLVPWSFSSLPSSLLHTPAAVYTLALGFTWNESISATCHISKLPQPTVQDPFSFLPPSSCCALTSLTRSARSSASGVYPHYPDTHFPTQPGPYNQASTRVKYLTFYFPLSLPQISTRMTVSTLVS